MSIFHIDLMQLVETAGYLGLFFIIFAESGLFFGFFFPGDSLLFTAGLLASQNYMSITLLLPLLAAAAVLGDNVGYWFGAKIGPALFSREDSFFFHKRHLERAHAFYAKYGARAILTARVIPVVRTFAPIVAGIARMPYRTFFTYNMAGGIVWSTFFLLFGFFLGASVPGADQYTTPIVIVIIATSFIPVIIEIFKKTAALRSNSR